MTVFGDSVVHGDHLAAHLVFTDFAGLVLNITGTHGGADLWRNEAAVNLPVEEAFSGVTRPESAVAVESRDSRLQA